MTTSRTAQSQAAVKHGWGECFSIFDRHPHVTEDESGATYENITQKDTWTNKKYIFSTIFMSACDAAKTHNS